MLGLAFLIAVVFAGLIVLVPIAGITVYLITRPWLVAYRQRQRALGLYEPAEPYSVTTYQSRTVREYHGEEQR